MNSVREKYYLPVWYTLASVIPCRSQDNTLLDLQNSSYPTQPHSIINNFSFKIFPHFWLVKSTSIIHLNQLLLTKFRKNFVILNQMTSKVLSYWTNDENDVKSAAHCRLLNRKYVERLIKQLLNSGFVGYEEFCTSRRELCTKAAGRR